MRRIFILIMMSLLLTACGNGEDTTEDSAEETDESNGSESGESSSNEQESGESSEDESETVEAAEIIDESMSAWGDAASYEGKQTFTIKDGDSQTVLRTITTQSEQDEVKVELDNGDNVVTHYILPETYFIYQDGEITEQEESVEMGEGTYGDIIAQLESFKDGNASRTDSGYEIQYPVESVEDASVFLDEETMDTLGEADDVNGLITINLNEEYQYRSGELTLTVTTDGREINLISNVDYSRINEINVLEKPKNM